MSHLVCCLSVSQERLARLSVKLSLPEAQLREAPYRVFPIHPSFRVVCLAAPPEKGRQWLTNEVRGEENIQCIIFTVPGSEHNYTVNLIKCFTASTAGTGHRHCLAELYWSHFQPLQVLQLFHFFLLDGGGLAESPSSSSALFSSALRTPLNAPRNAPHSGAGGVLRGHGQDERDGPDERNGNDRNQGKIANAGKVGMERRGQADLIALIQNAAPHCDPNVIGKLVKARWLLRRLVAGGGGGGGGGGG